MKKLVLLFAVILSVGMASCVVEKGENKSSASTESVSGVDSTSVVVENPSAPATEEVKPSNVNDAAQPSKPIEDKKAEETVNAEPSK